MVRLQRMSMQGGLDSPPPGGGMVTEGRRVGPPRASIESISPRGRRGKGVRERQRRGRKEGWRRRKVAERGRRPRVERSEQSGSEREQPQHQKTMTTTSAGLVARDYDRLISIMVEVSKFQLLSWHCESHTVQANFISSH